MEQKTACFVSCSDHYGHRFRIPADYLRSQGYAVTYITSDFDHYTKQPFVCRVPDCVQISAPPYRKNLSVARILSHRRFARNVMEYLEQLPRQPDVLIMLLPPNFLGHYAAKYRRRHPQVKLIFDIFDLWPETFPIGRLKKLLAPAFAVWARIRDRSLPAADYVITECDLFRRMLALPENRSRSIYLCDRPVNALQPVCLPEDRVNLCYIGAINNVIGIDEICKLIRETVACKPVTFHIIGAGEREQELIDSARTAGAEVVFHGAVYDDDAKQEIIKNCHFGLNIMRSTVCVGLTMKSIEYFRHGLPIINSIPADTRALVEERSVGLQLENVCGKAVADVSTEENLQMRENVRTVFDEIFDRTVVERKYAELFDEIL